MTQITDVPVSGIYYQQGAITQIVLQFLDAITGLPVQLQAATGLTIALLYPDRITTQSFAAALFTDGSDGCIFCTLRNNGSNVVDLNQVGLYFAQGYASIGGVSLPPSSEADFYVLANVMMGQQPSSGFSASAIIFFDNIGVRWAMTVTTGGAIVFAATPNGPPSSLYLSQVVLQDPDGIYWRISVLANGTYLAVPGGEFADALESFILNDTSGKSWVVTITTSGVLIAS